MDNEAWADKMLDEYINDLRSGNLECITAETLENITADTIKDMNKYFNVDIDDPDAIELLGALVLMRCLNI